MVRVTKDTYLTNDVHVKEIYCESSDTKPTDGLATGSVCIEVDTGNAYFWSEKTSSWKQQ